MQNSGEAHEVDSAIAMPSWFKYFIGISAFFIAGCSAFFSVRGLGLLFIGSATAVMIMAASLEIGKLVAASFLYRYWNVVSRALRAYLFVAVLLLIGITSLGNYGYLARAYERTHTRVTGLEEQIAALDKENADTQRQIDSARGQLTKTTDTGHESVTSLQQRITQANTSLDQALARTQEKRQTAQARRDRDIGVLAQRQAERADLLNKAMASAEATITGLNARIAVLDRAVDAYTAQGGPGLFKIDSIKKGQELREQQQPERDRIAAQINDQQTQQGQLRAELAASTKVMDTETAGIRQQFAKETSQLETEEQQLRQASTTSLAETEKQLATAQTLGMATTTAGDTQIETLHQRIRTRNEEIRHIREQIAATDIGSYRFVARAFEAPADSVVKWLILALVLVFDPLAVSLAVGFNIAMIRERRPSSSPLMTTATIEPAISATATAPVGARRPRWVMFGASLFAIALLGGAVATAVYWGAHSMRVHSRAGHAGLVPAESFAVVTVRPAELARSAQSQNLAEWLSNMGGKKLTEVLPVLLAGGFDAQADVYAFAKFPAEGATEKSDRPVMLCGLVARVADAAAAETALVRLADQLNQNLRASDGRIPSPAHNRAMIRSGNGRYLDPEGGFFTFCLRDGAAVVLLELEGNPQSPLVEKEIQACLAIGEKTEKLPARALNSDGAMAVWFDAGRFFNHLPKNALAEARYQQLQRFLGFDLVLKVAPAGNDQVSVTADYAYQADRFKDRMQPTAVQVLAGLGSSDPSGLGGRLMDRCADTLDYDSLIERLRTTLGGTGKTGAQEVLVEKAFSSDRDARFVLNVRYNPQAGPPLVAAVETLLK